MHVKELIEQIHLHALDKGWWASCEIGEGEDGLPILDREKVESLIPVKIALGHSELSEAFQAYRDGMMSTTSDPNGKPEGFPAELADAAILIFVLAGALGIDLEAEIQQRLTYHKTRPYRHGRRC